MDSSRGVEEFLNLPPAKEKFRDKLLKQIADLKRVITICPAENKEEVKTKNRCCGKRAFNTEQEALDAIVQRTERNGYKPKRAYECDNGKWHLTSMKINDWYKKK